MTTTDELLLRGMDCLVNNLGDVEAQRFISAIMREKFDYTRWRREHFDDINADTFLDAAVAYANGHPHASVSRGTQDS